MKVKEERENTELKMFFLKGILRDYTSTPLENNGMI